MRRLIPSFLVCLAFSCGARADILPPYAQPGMLCRSAIAAAERGSAIPNHLLAAIGRIESGRRDPRTGSWHPWPWTINAEGQGYFLDSKAEAIAAVKALQARGVRSIDVGCMQVNLMHHPNAFASLDQAFDPMANVAYAAQFLSQLFGQSGAWPKAAGLYHSATPDIGADYERQVVAVWPEESRRQQEAAGGAGSAMPRQLDPVLSAWAARLPTAPSNRVAVVMPANPADNIRVIPLSSGGALARGRGLDSYRSAPIAIASRQARIGG